MTFRKLLLLIVISGCQVDAFPQETFTNPLLPSGPDPWSIYVDGYYYYTHSMQNRIVIWKTNNLANLKEAEEKTIFQPPPGKEYSKELWAPEIHYIDGVWYAYFAADDGNNDNHRMYVLRNKRNPMVDEWEFLGQIKGMTDNWAIDGSVFTHQKQLYMVWSGWEGDKNGRQDIFIAKMKNPWTVQGDRVKLSSPEYDWERNGTLYNEGKPYYVYVNEGPQILEHGENLFLIYSASGCWTDNYSLGMLTISKDADLLSPGNWTKSKTPVFSQSPENGVYAPGHNSFFKSPDGTEDWILYHANDEAGFGCGPRRSPRAQKFTWGDDGRPVFGKPVGKGVPLNIPSR